RAARRVGAAANPGQVEEEVRPGDRPGRPDDLVPGQVVAPGVAQRALVQAEGHAVADRVQAGRARRRGAGDLVPGDRVEPDEGAAADDVDHLAGGVHHL